jgi:hypothetical protein
MMREALINNYNYIELALATYKLEADYKEMLRAWEHGGEFNYAYTLLEHAKLEGDVENSIFLLEEVANLDDTNKDKACLMIGRLCAMRDPKKAEMYLRRIENQSEFFGEACQQLAYINQNSKEKFPFETIKVLAYYAIAIEKKVAHKLEALSWADSYLGSLQSNHKNPSKGDADLAYKVLRCQHQEELISTATYIERLQQLIQRINGKGEDFAKVLAKSEYQLAKANLILAKEQDSIEHLNQAKAYASNVVNNHMYKKNKEERKQAKALVLESVIQTFLDKQNSQTTPGYWDRVKEITASSMEFFGVVGYILGASLGNLLDLCTLFASKNFIQKSIVDVNRQQGKLTLANFVFDYGFGWLGSKGLGVAGVALGVIVGITFGTIASLVEAAFGANNRNTESNAISEFVDPILKFENDSLQKDGSNKKGLFNRSNYNKLPLPVSVVPDWFRQDTVGINAGTSVVYGSPLHSPRNMTNILEGNEEWLVPAYRA